MTSTLANAGPTPEQRRAADPGCSVWVTASAGTGKTRVLADRVLRLLLAGTHPQRLLCLTFTKAAAAEMVTRIQADLGAFATLPAPKLDRRLQSLLGHAPGDVERTRARVLFADVLDLPAGLPIMTIHAFCQSLLRRFPLEAGVVPHFELIEERESNVLIHDAKEEVLTSRRPELQDALARLAVQHSDESLTTALDEVCAARTRLGALVARSGGLDATIARICGVLGATRGRGEDEIRRATCADPAIDLAGLRRACRVLAGGSAGDRARAEVIGAWLERDVDGRAAGHRDYEGVFLTTERGPKQPGSIITGQAPDHDGRAVSVLLAEQARLLAWVEQEKAAACAERTEVFLRAGWAVIEAYERKKTERAALDFDDLIAHAGALLSVPGIGAWVQYKLDQRIEHLLVDEGQDTSPEQWAVVTALCADFFAGRSAQDAPRTLFVVGDEKQSIFSFQGADLETFQRLRKDLRTRARTVRHGWREETLSRSFRSTEAVLQVVDAVFAAEEARAGVVSDPAPLRHRSARDGEAGLVEVWPLVEAESEDERAPWQLPDAFVFRDRPERHLARAIAETVRRWITNETRLPSNGAPVRPGDVMVLLPRRGIMQDQLIREFKRLKVPVSGSDRLALTDDLAVMDLMALGDAVLLPDDSLTLAALLKSPLFDLSEDQLFELAYERGGATLHQRLRARAGDDPVFAEAFERFGAYRALADYVPPYEFFARVLTDGGRHRFLERLGPQALEPIEAFLAQALAYERGHPPSLQGFLHWLRADSTELRRDPDEPRDELRVLTVHGAKGLQAPIVIIADSTTTPRFKDRLLWREQDGLPLWRSGKPERDRVGGAAWDEARARQLEEHRRLLYVAMTRARDWLIVAGWQKKDRNGSERTWYDLVADGMERIGAERVSMSITREVAGEGWRHRNRPPAAAQLPFGAAKETEPPPAPLWLHRAARPDGTPGTLLHPSQLAEGGEPPATSPVAGRDDLRFRRGRIVHRLLQSLPDRPLAERSTALDRYLAQPSLGLPDDARRSIAAEVDAVLNDPGIGAVFAPGSRAEVPIAGRIGERTISGQVDRLAVTADEVLVVDYKTNRAPPATPDDIPVLYWRQMAAYRDLLRRIYPGRRVRCALVWTEGPRLMVLDDAELERQARGLDPA